jgi:site-specific recombinase XerD
MYKNSHQITKLKEANLIHNSDLANKNLCYYANKYFCLFVENSSTHTERAKKTDLNSFLVYYIETLGSDDTKLWTPSITRGFQKMLAKRVSSKTKTNYAATTINRIIAAIQHFGRWLHKEIHLPGGHPCQGLTTVQVEEPTWNGILPKIITRLKAACEIRMNACK